MSTRRHRLKGLKKKTKPYNSPKPEDLDNIVGRWRVVSVEFVPDGSIDDSDTEQTNISFPDYAGVEVSLDNQCDVTWTLKKGVEVIPLFQTTSFNIEKEILDLFGGIEGRMFTFEVEEKEDGVLALCTVVEAGGEAESGLTGAMTLTIERIKNPPEVTLDGFTLKAALEEGFFSDLVVRSSDGSSFNVHRTVLGTYYPNMGYRDWEILLSSMKTPMAQLILCYVYTHRLPTSLSLSAAKDLLSVIDGQPKLSRLSEMCRAFIGSHNLKQRLIQLVDDLQTSLELAKKMIDNTDVTNPVKVTYTLKQLAKEAAVGVTKFGLLCELYTRNKKEMTKPEKQEVLEYVRGRVVVFIDLLSELIESALAKYTLLTEAQRQETATYIIPEVERVWDLINMTCVEVKAAMQSSVSSLKSKRRLTRQDIKISVLIQLITRGGEAKRLHAIVKEFDDFLETSSGKRDDFNEMTEAEKISKILRAIEGLEKEGNTQRNQLQAAKAQILMENALEWKKFKVLVAICCTYVAWGLRRLQHLKGPMLPNLLKVCKFVQRSEFNQALVYFDLLSETDIRSLRDDDDDDDDPSDGAGLNDTMPSLATPTLSDNQLAHGCYKLFGSDELTDMRFVLLPVHQPSDDPKGGVATDDPEGVVIRAHRVIVASRCEWFRRALQSGMKEAIDRQIVIRECTEYTFRLFLSYLYGGPLETDKMTIDDIIELLAVADHYETTVLRGRCEECLVSRVEDSTVFPLLQVADRYSTRRLRETTLQHILNDPDVIMSEVDGYSDLHDDLKKELRTLLSATTDPHLLIRHAQPPGTGTGTEARISYSSGDNSSDDQMPADVYGGGSPTSGVDEKVSELRAIVGDDATDELLRDLLEAADMDINRAVNFYFNTQ